jgi:aromatic ring-opening dioxygenase LigB subunit
MLHSRRMALVLAALLPHPKALVSDEKNSKYKKTSDGFAAVQKLLLDKNPDTLLLLSARPIGPLDAFSVPPANPGAFYLPGLDRMQVGLPHLDPDREPLVFVGDVDLNRAIRERVKEQGLMAEKTPHSKLEEPSSLALYSLHISTEHDMKLNYIGLPYQSPEKLLVFGKILREILDAYTKNVAVIAVADLSARLSTESAAGFKAEGKAFDEAVLSATKKNNFDELLSQSEETLELAGEEASRPLAVLVGATRDSSLKPAVVSYEAPEGIGHAVLTWS